MGVCGLCVAFLGMLPLWRCEEWNYGSFMFRVLSMGNAQLRCFLVHVSCAGSASQLACCLLAFDITFIRFMSVLVVLVLKT